MASPFAARVRSKLLGAIDVPAAAVQAVQIATSIRREQPSAISLSGELERVTAFAGGYDLQMGRLNAGLRQHGATTAYQLDHAALADGRLYFDGGYRTFRPGGLNLFPARKALHLQEAQLCSSYVIERYFGHWIRDGLLQEMLASERSMPALTPNRTPWLHELGYRHITNLFPVATDHAHVEKLWVVDDLGLNDHWLRRFELLRMMVRASATPGGPKRVMIRRGVLGVSRDLVNEREIEAALEKLGFDIVAPELETPQGLASKLAHAEITVVVEGSAHNHCLLAMPAGSKLVTIQPPRRFNAIAKTFADPVGIRWGYTVAEDTPGGFTLPVDRLMRTIFEAN